MHDYINILGTIITVALYAYTYLSVQRNDLAHIYFMKLNVLRGTPLNIDG